MSASGDFAVWLDQYVIDREDAAVAPVQSELDVANAQIAARDATVADLQQQVTDLQAQVTDLEAQLNPPPPEPTPAPVPDVKPILIGTTLRGTASGDSTSLPRPQWDIVRTYNIGDALTALNKGKGRLVATSFGSMLGGPGWRNNTTTVANLKSQLAQLPDVPGLRVGDTHEFDNPNKYGADYTTYLADAAKFKQTVDTVNAGRQNPLTIFRCCMAYSLSQPARQIDDFYTRDPGNYDEFGPDVYKVPDIDLAVKKAKQYGKPLCVPEMGPLDNVAQNDPAILDYMQQGVAAWDGLATWVAWFDKKGAGADLDQYPNALDYWTRQNAR